MRIELYKLAADTLVRTWRPAQGVPSSVLIDNHFLTPLLGQLAYWMHEHKPTGVATEREVYDQLGTALAKRQRVAAWDPDNPDPTVKAEIDKFLIAVREHTGLFVERAPKRYGFMHLTFEEYFAPSGGPQPYPRPAYQATPPRSTLGRANPTGIGLCRLGLS